MIQLKAQLTFAFTLIVIFITRMVVQLVKMKEW